jgi:undecaprenyl-diphosphatase
VRSVAPSTVAAAGVGVGLFTLLVVAVGSGLSNPLDRALIELVRQDVGGSVTVWRTITDFGSTWAITGVALLTFILGVTIGPWLQGLVGALTIGLASFANSILKLVIARTRPDLLEPILDERGFSFPSGHSLLGMVGWGILAVLVMRSRLPLSVRWAMVAVLGALILLIGVSRIWLGVHYPTDVLAGWTAGAVIVLLYARLTRRVSPEPAAAAVDADPGPRRSDPPAAG